MRLARESMERKMPTLFGGLDGILDAHDISQVFGAGSATDLTDADFDKYFLSSAEDDLADAHAGGSGS